MRTPEEIEKAITCCFGMESCDGCPYIKNRCKDITTSQHLIDDMITLIEQLEKKVKDAEAAIDERDMVISLMQIQMRGDCGCCKHGKDGKAEPCTSCLASREYHPRWEYEGLPEIPKGYVLPKKGES